MVQELFRTVHRNGYFVPKTTMSAISPSTGRTLPDRYIEGTCPICGYDGARGDQCDNCGNQLDPIDLINPHSRINGETPKFVESEHFFLDLPALAGALGAWLQTRTDWRPNVLRFSLNLLDDLRPRAMTRDIDWGIPVPLDGWRDRPDKKLYVWFDAVIGYLSASIEWARRYGANGKPDPGGLAALVAGRSGPVSTTSWARTTSPSTRRSGRPSCSPTTARASGAALRARSAGSNLPTEVVSSEFLTMSGSKFSTSRKTVIYVGDFLREYGPDALRYFIAAAGPENQDADFTWEEFVRRTNFELANEWGNLVNRSISMAHKNFGADPGSRRPLTDLDVELLRASEQAFDDGRRPVGPQPVQGRVRRGDAGRRRWRTSTSPNPSRGNSAATRNGRRTVLHTALQVVDDAKTLLTPFLPHSSQQVFEALGGQGVWAAQPEIREVTDFDDDVEGVGVPEVVRLPGDHRRLRRRAGDLAAAADRGRPAADQADARCSPSSTPKLGETGPSWAPIA